MRENHDEKIQFKMDLPIPPCLLENNSSTGISTDFKLDLPNPPCLLEPKQELLENNDIPEENLEKDKIEEKRVIRKKKKKKK